jgi:hypothetical protein
MPTRLKTCWPNWADARFLVPVLLVAVLVTGCADDRKLVAQTLDARSEAFNNLDARAYLKLISPDYQANQPGFDPGASARRLFARVDSMQFQVFERNIEFQADGTARAVQRYKMVFTGKNGKTHQISSADNFLLKRHGTWPLRHWLIYQGLDGGGEPAPPQGADVTPENQGATE